MRGSEIEVRVAVFAAGGMRGREGQSGGVKLAGSEDVMFTFFLPRNKRCTTFVKSNSIHANFEAEIDVIGLKLSLFQAFALHFLPPRSCPCKHAPPTRLPIRRRTTQPWRPPYHHYGAGDPPSTHPPLNSQTSTPTPPAPSNPPRASTTASP